jgi:enoyl-CoA hydratase/carnithine racemase
MDECVALKELGDDQRVRAILGRGEGCAFSVGST